MKYILVGLGNFGASLAEKLTMTGNEVIGVDIKLSKVEDIKHKITHAINLDATEIGAVSNLPLNDTDVVIVGIGEDMGANIMATALMKQMKVKRLISRAVSPLQEMVLQAMGVKEIIHPEEETAERWSKKLNLHGVVDSFELNKEFSIIETKIPKKYDGRVLEEVGLKRDFNIIVLTTMEISQEKNEIGSYKEVPKINDVASAQTVLRYGDIMVLYGSNKNLKKFLKSGE